jgi:hypothetical protein
MDEENAHGKEMRITMDATDRQCVGHPPYLHNQCMLISRSVWKVIFSTALLRPFKLFIYEPINATSWSLPGIYIWSPLSYALRISSVYAILHFSVFLTTIPTTFQDVYHDRVGIAGLHYLALGFGLSVPLQINAMLMDKIYTLLKARNGGVGRPEFRLREYHS